MWQPSASSLYRNQTLSSWRLNFVKESRKRSSLRRTLWWSCLYVFMGGSVFTITLILPNLYPESLYITLFFPVILSLTLTCMAIYFIQKHTRNSRSPSSPLELISSKGIVVKECGPSGTVRIWGELWNAKSLSGSRIEVGKTVVVRHVEGLLVFVEQQDDE